jgi:hypothetical protein
MHKSRGAGLELFIKVIGCFASNAEESIFAGDAMMDAGGGQEVPHAIEFMYVGHFEAVGSVIADLRGDVAIGGLCLCDDIDPFVHQPVEFWVPGNLIDQSYGFEPFITIAIAPGDAATGTFFKTCRDFEVDKVFGIQRIKQTFVYAWENGATAQLKLFGPESFGPPDGIQIDVPHSYMWAARRVDQFPIHSLDRSQAGEND